MSGNEHAMNVSDWVDGLAYELAKAGPVGCTNWRLVVRRGLRAMQERGYQEGYSAGLRDYDNIIEAKS